MLKTLTFHMHFHKESASKTANLIEKYPLQATPSMALTSGIRETDSRFFELIIKQDALIYTV